MAPIPTLFLIIFLEGYVVLSTELLAIRLLVPFTGSGTDTVSIVIAAVLLPLAFGYAAGGKFKIQGQASVRKKLIRNLVAAAGILTVGLSHVFLDWSFIAFEHATGIYNRVILTALYSGLFVVGPVYLLGQTVPLVSNYFSRERLSLIAGRILFFSTLGSFMGAVFGTLILMAFLGVHHTVSVTLACMTLLVFILSKRKLSAQTALMTAFLGLTLALNSAPVMEKLNIVSNNKYNVVQVVEHKNEGMRALMINRSFASAIYTHSPDTYMEYAIFVEDNFIAPIREQGPEKSILVLGAGGFALGRTDLKNKYVYVDIDDALKKVAEEDFLKEALPPSKTFVPMDARAYLIQAREKYDLIILDLFRDPVSVPENLNTVEFFHQVREHLNEGGVMVGNFVGSPSFSDAFSRNLDQTLRAAFPALNRQIIREFDVWKRENDWHNIIYSYVRHKDEAAAVYTDDKNTILYDRPVNMFHQE